MLFILNFNLIILAYNSIQSNECSSFQVLTASFDGYLKCLIVHQFDIYRNCWWKSSNFTHSEINRALTKHNLQTDSDS